MYVSTFSTMGLSRHKPGARGRHAAHVLQVRLAASKVAEICDRLALGKRGGLRVCWEAFRLGAPAAASEPAGSQNLSPAVEVIRGIITLLIRCKTKATEQDHQRTSIAQHHRGWASHMWLVIYATFGYH